MAPRYSSIVVAALLGSGIADLAGPAYGTYTWPVEGPVIRSFEPPSDPYGAGHRGIDIGAPFGTDVVAAEEGIVAFAGWIGGSLFVSIDHDDGVRSTYSWLSGVDVAEGQTVQRSQTIGNTGQGHPDLPTPHLHFGTKVGDTYIDPMLMLERGNVAGLIHLAPFAPAERMEPSPPWWEEWDSRATYNERSWTPIVDLFGWGRDRPAGGASRVPPARASLAAGFWPGWPRRSSPWGSASGEP